MQRGGNWCNILPYGLLFFIFGLSAFAVLGRNSPLMIYIVLGMTVVVPLTALAWSSSDRWSDVSTPYSISSREGRSRRYPNRGELPMRTVSETVAFMELTWDPEDLRRLRGEEHDLPPAYSEERPPPSYQEAINLPEQNKY